MSTLRSNRWAFVLLPALLIPVGCGNNESGVNFKGSTSSPDAVSTPEEMLKRAEAAPVQKTAPAGYPGGRR